MNNELVSIVMATYNGEKYLRPQLESICNQTYQNIEIIVVDDSSTDKTVSILNEYAALDKRIHLFPAKQNLGFSLNFERGLKLAQGDFIALSDQDDIFCENKIELLLQSLKNHPTCDMALSDLFLIDEKGEKLAASMWDYAALRPKSGKPFRRLLYSNFATGCAIMIRRRLLELALPFPKDCTIHDWWLAVVAASSKAGGICLINKQLTAYRQHNSNVFGIKNAELSTHTVISQMKAKPRGYDNFKKRIILYNQYINQLKGYLQKSIWSSKEQEFINESIKIFKDYENDIHDNLIKRISKLPHRLGYALICGKARFFFATVLHTIAPYK